MSDNSVAVAEPSRVAPAPAKERMPFAMVMATGAAAALAGVCGLRPLADPLVWLAVAEAVGIPLLAVIGGRTRVVGKFGLFTVPIGLAVIGTGLAGWAGAAARDAAFAAVVPAWLLTVAVAVRIVLGWRGERPCLAAVSGVWFLAPACLLADAGATAALLPRLPDSLSSAAHAAAWAGCGLGTVGYPLLVLAAALRVRRTGLGSPRAPWWISAGCGGLAAATLGRMTAVSPAHTHALGRASLTAWCLGSVLLLPVLAGSVRHLLALRRPWGAVVWPPTFSTGVYALGARQAGRLTHLPAVTTVGTVAAAATLALWAATTLLRAADLPAFSGGGARSRGVGGAPGGAEQ